MHKASRSLAFLNNHMEWLCGAEAGAQVVEPPIASQDPVGLVPLWRDTASIQSIGDFHT